MAWDTPAVEFLPIFAVADPVLTQKITMRNLVCACTGVPRRDLEIIFNAGSFTAEDIVASLRSFEFFTGFGEAFQYSNQMVATGGYLAALAGGGHSDDLYGAYLEQMQERVFDPIGMPNTTFDFDEVTASPDYAIPHGANALHEFSPVPVSSERVLIPVAPAGAAWSNARDMARYLITELNEGVSPDGVRVVSAENLRVTWEPQVPVAAETSYGLGWFVDHYQGLPLLHHGGNTAGFTTDLAFLPGADLGIVVITNARLSNYFNEAVRFRLFELAFDQPAEHHAQFQFALESLAKADQDLSLELLPGADPEAVAPYLGTFSNPALGDMTLSMTGDHLMMDAGEFATELRPRVDADGRTTYIMYGPLWAGYVLEFKQGPDGGEPSIVVLSPPDKYVFTRK
jgi:CubicO group peptidase (beta-lactamase class C family)